MCVSSLIMLVLGPSSSIAGKSARGGARDGFGACGGGLLDGGSVAGSGGMSGGGALYGRCGGTGCACVGKLGGGPFGLPHPGGGLGSWNRVIPVAEPAGGAGKSG